MANLSTTTPRNYQRPIDNVIDYPMTNAKIYEGAALSDAGSPGSGTNVAHNLVAGENFLGFAAATVDNSGGSSGGTTIETIVEGVIQIAVTGVTAASLGASVYMSDGNTFTTTSTSNSKIGTVLKIVSGTTVLVHFKGVGYVI